MEELGLVEILASVIVGAFAWWMKRISAKLDELSVHRETCIGQFADNAKNTEAHGKIFDDLSDHESRICVLESIPIEYHPKRKRVKK